MSQARALRQEAPSHADFPAAPEATASEAAAPEIAVPLTRLIRVSFDEGASAYGRVTRATLLGRRIRTTLD